MCYENLNLKGTSKKGQENFQLINLQSKMFIWWGTGGRGGQKNMTWFWERFEVEKMYH